MRFICSKCNGIIEIDDSERGNPVGCGHCGKFVVVPEKKIASNVVINNDFILKEKLGQGGVGSVHKAHQISLDRPVALKILMEQFAQDKTFVEDFIREARAAARLNHPNIVQSFAVGQENGIFFCAMELIVGETLKDIIAREGKVSIDYSIQIMRQITEALDFAWKNQKLVHRDIKPDNIMITTSGVSKLADLGLARIASEVEEDDDEIMGTPQYISPEQLIGGKTDIRTDLYSLGATWYHAITGKFPFNGDSPQEIAQKHLEAQLVAPNQINPDIPKSVSVMICKMMAKHPDDRYRDAEELIQDLKLLSRDLKSKSTVPRRKKGGALTGSLKIPTTNTCRVSTLTTKTNSLKISTTTGPISTKTQRGAQLLSKTGPLTLSSEKTEQSDYEEKKSLPIVPIVAGLLAVLLVVTLATRKTEDQKNIDALVARGIQLPIAEMVVKFENKVHAKENPWKKEDYQLVLNEFEKLHKGIKNYKKVISPKALDLIDLSTEMQIRDLRKK